MYSETLLVEDKWAEWSQYQSNLILSNISGVSTTLALDNIDWKNKSIQGSSNETIHENFILIQQKVDQQLNQEKSPVPLCHDRKMKWEIKRISKRTLVWEVS